jgi:quinoprotein glucose dehydrogenase
MSYEAGGKQYVVIAAGGHGGLGTRSGDYIIAYTLDGAQGAGAQATGAQGDAAH